MSTIIILVIITIFAIIIVIVLIIVITNSSNSSLIIISNTINCSCNSLHFHWLMISQTHLECTSVKRLPRQMVGNDSLRSSTVYLVWICNTLPRSLDQDL